LRTLWFILGCLALALGVIGLFLPIMPTAPFIILAALAFSRSSERLHAWLLAHPQFGPIILNWQDYGAIAPWAKALSVSMMSASVVIGWLMGLSPLLVGVHVAIVAAVAVFILTRPSGPPG
jgi:uncharacterized membrane protein YbaN (DUF454 family)